MRLGRTFKVTFVSCRYITGIILTLALLSLHIGCDAHEELVNEPEERHPLEAESKIIIDPDGGYHVTLAIQQDTNEPSDAGALLENIQTHFEEASTLLHGATKGTFFFASLDVIIPGHWDIKEYQDEPILPQTTESFENADVRMGRAFQGVHVHNSNPCGKPGDYIDLPIDFFQDTSDSIYGPQHKALLVAWARFRWGVWEEHGYPGSEIFPYFYKDNSVEWKPNGCSSEELTGSIISIQGQPADTCSKTDPLYPPQSHCRFVPHENQPLKPTSSITYFPFLPSVTKFCEDSNHNPNAPNKQNLYCNYQSVFSVIQNTTDFLQVETPLSSPPSLNVTITKQSFRPHFYLLVDSSKVIVPQPILKEIIDGVNILFEKDNENIVDVIGKAATFSKVNVPWIRMTDDLHSFIATTEEYQNGKNPPEPFSFTIEKVIEELITKKHPHGAVILVLKHGASSSSYSTNTYEADLISKLRDSNVILNAVEIKMKKIDPMLHLENMVAGSGGYYMSIDPSIEDKKGKVKLIVKKVNEQLQSLNKKPSSVPVTLFKSFISKNSVFSLPLQYASLPADTEIKFSLTFNEALDYEPRLSPPLVMTEGPTDHKVEIGVKSMEWNEVTNGKNRETLDCTLKIKSNHFEKDWKFTYTGPEAFLLMSYTYPEDYVFPNSPFEIIVSTSADGKEFSFEDSKEPLIVYASVRKDGEPVVLLDHVEVILQSYESKATYRGFFLKDDGPNSVDIASGDGIYSGAIVPPVDGNFYLNFIVSGARYGKDSLVDYVHEDYAVHRLMHMDQEEVGCPSTSVGCNVVALERGRLEFADIKYPIKMKGVDTWEAKGGKVLDLTAEAVDEYRIKLSWRAPYVFSKNRAGNTFDVLDDPRMNYTVRFASSAEDLRNGDSFQRAEVLEFGDAVSFVPGTLNQVVVDPGTSKFLYFAVVLTIDDVEVSSPSNVVGVLPSQVRVVRTTTTTTIAPSTEPATPPPTARSTQPSEPSEPSTESVPTHPDGYTTSTEVINEKVPRNEYWYETTEGVLVLAIFGGALALVFILAVIYLCVINRRRLCGGSSKPSYDQFS